MEIIFNKLKNFLNRLENIFNFCKFYLIITKIRKFKFYVKYIINLTIDNLKKKYIIFNNKFYNILIKISDTLNLYYKNIINIIIIIKWNQIKKNG